MLLQRGPSDQPCGSRIAGHPSKIAGEDDFRLRELPKGEFCCPLEIVAGRKAGEAGADAVAYAIGLGILLLFCEFHAAKVIGQEMVRIDFEDRIQILICGRELVLFDVDLGAAQPSPRIPGVEPKHVAKEALAKWSGC